MMMNGKAFSLILGFFAVGLAVGLSNKNNFSKNIGPSYCTATIDQYLNRLKEFFLNDVDTAKKEFFELLDMGINPSDCFEIVVSKVVLV